jgi:hypothetical protein
MVEVLDPKVILSGIWRQVPQLGPKALLVPLMHFRYPSRRCSTCVSPHLNFVFQRRLFSHIFLPEERLAFRFGDLAICRSALSPKRLCFVAAPPDDLKLSRKMSRANIKMQTYPQATWFAVDKLAEKIGAQTNTASTQCMKAVRFNRGRGREEESAARLKCVSASLPLTVR